MKLFTAEDFQAVIDALPDNAGTQSAYQMLMMMRDENAVDIQPFNYEVDFATTITQGSGNLFAAPAAVGGQSTGNFLVDAAAPWMWISQAMWTDAAGAATTISTRPTPNWTISITEAASNRNWQNAAVAIGNIFGTQGGLPYMLPRPRLLPGNSNVQMTVTNYDAAAVDNVRLTFMGYRLYSTRKAQ